MLFAHFSDCHIGGWKEEKLQSLNMAAFHHAVDLVIKKKCDFLLIAGDLFNTALPPIEYIKEITTDLRKLKDNKIPVYVIAGSHDFSMSGKTMLDVLERARLLINVMKFDHDGNLIFTIDPKTNAKITGLYGKKGRLEKSSYANLRKDLLEREEGFKIFMFHTAINEFKPIDVGGVDGEDLASLPQNFHYYAGGHIHYILQKQFGKGVLTFPGALFPNNFKELEEWKHGGVYFVKDTVEWEYVPIQLKKVISFTIDVTGKTPEAATHSIREEVKLVSVKDSIVTLRISGEVDGDPTNLSFPEIFAAMDDPYIVLKNTAKLFSKTPAYVSMKQGSIEDIEKEIIKEGAKESTIYHEEELCRLLIDTLNKEKLDGEKNEDFERRLLVDALKVMELETD